SGSKTIAQDENSSVVWGMPGEAVKLGAADYVLPLNQIARKIDMLIGEDK
ncbi:MAG: chemotaxis response regulator protein-glutamate methylesterase, partial [Gammaproteobacteria bacterium]|nr:chemotaxis response regulator protein-glutamate methylesterase [Gammaproteobacteria bacterium]